MDARKASHWRGHTWMMLLMCLPMLVLIGTLVVTGAVGAGALVYGLGCLVMMAVMMRLMSSGDHRH